MLITRKSLSSPGTPISSPRSLPRLLSLLDSPRSIQKNPKYNREEIEKLINSWLNKSGSEDHSYDESCESIDDSEISMDEDFAFSYNKIEIFEVFKLIIGSSGDSIFNEIKNYGLSVSLDAAIFLNTLTLNYYGELSLVKNFDMLKNIILSYPIYIKNLILSKIKRGIIISDNITIIIETLIVLIMNASIQTTVNKLLKNISYKIMNIAILSDDDLNVILKSDVIPKKYIFSDIDIEIYYDYPLLIPTEFEKFLKLKNVILNSEQINFLSLFSYHNYIDKKQNLEFIDYINKLLGLIDSSMSFRQFTTTLINN